MELNQHEGRRGRVVSTSNLVQSSRGRGEVFILIRITYLSQMGNLESKVEKCNGQGNIKTLDLL